MQDYIIVTALDIRTYDHTQKIWLAHETTFLDSKQVVIRIGTDKIPCDIYMA